MPGKNRLDRAKFRCGWYSLPTSSSAPLRASISALLSALLGAPLRGKNQLNRAKFGCVWYSLPAPLRAPLRASMSASMSAPLSAPLSALLSAPFSAPMSAPCILLLHAQLDVAYLIRAGRRSMSKKLASDAL